MIYTLPPLPFDYSALEPYLDAETMKLHHDKHHQTYVDKLNQALEKNPQFEDIPLEKLLENTVNLPPAVINHGGGHLNHSLFWQLLSPTPSTPSLEFAQALTATYGSFEAFKLKFADTALAHFGSGWAWLVWIPKSKSLDIYSLPNQDSPLSKGHIPLLTVDIWEHAYYLKYQNRRPEYLDAFWHIVNWQHVNKLYQGVL
jgi:superoxide dismutase, Fe-Mn family